MTTLTYPSDDFPGPSTVRLQIPEDWHAVHVPGTALAAAREDRPGTFTPNVVVRMTTRPADSDVAEALAELREYARSKPEGVVSEPFTAELSGVRFLGCDVSWVDGEAGTLVQAHLFGHVPRGELVELVQLTGSVGGAQAQEDYGAVKDVLQSLWIGD